MSKKTKVVKVAETTPVVEVEVTKNKPGRPVVTGSARQAKLALRAERIANGGGGLGRPSNPTSARQMAIAAKAARIAAGDIPKAGRPKMVKSTEIVADLVTTEADISAIVEAALTV